MTTRTTGTPFPHVPNKQKLLTFITPDEIDAEFSHHRPSVALINNSSFGSCPSSVISAQRSWQMSFLEQTDDFYFNSLKKAILHYHRIVKDLVNAEDVSEISLVDNATTAAAMVLQRMAWRFKEGTFRKGDAVVMLHYAYGAVKKSVEAYYGTLAGGRVIEVPLPFPVCSREQIVSEFREALERGKLESREVRLAVIDHVSLRHPFG